MNPHQQTFSISVNPTNPGQFFACCGLLELAERLWGEAEGCFGPGEFHLSVGGTLAELLREVAHAPLVQVDPDDMTSSRIDLGGPFRRLRLDWWRDELADGKALKVWAGTMESVRIARAMQRAMQAERFHTPDLFDIGVIAYDPDNAAKKVEPFYFDARRGPNAHSRDVGFSPNDLQMTTTAFPAVEFLCLVGLQRCRPARTDRSRVFQYFTWSQPTSAQLSSVAASGHLPSEGQVGYQFENWYRTGQRKHKAFRSATPL